MFLYNLFFSLGEIAFFQIPPLPVEKGGSNTAPGMGTLPSLLLKQLLNEAPHSICGRV